MPAGSASITEDGRCVADRPGTYTIIAAVGGVSDQLTLMVAAPAGGGTPEGPAPRVRAIDIGQVPHDAYAGTSVRLVADVRAAR